MIKYYKLFDLLNRLGMKKTDLLKVISSPTLAKLSKGETVKTDIIDKICIYMRCQPGDIMECIEKDVLLDKEGNDSGLRALYKPSPFDSESEEPYRIIGNIRTTGKHGEKSTDTKPKS